MLFYIIIFKILRLLTCSEKEFVVVIDAGSTGSRARIYDWINVPRKQIPKFSSVHSYRKEPGISFYANDLKNLTPYVVDLLENIIKSGKIPNNFYKNTEIFFMATAGMRLLSENKAEKIFTTIHGILSNSTINPFKYPGLMNARIISGEEEAVFAWIALNYENNVFDNNKNLKNLKTFGVVELGGASAQIAFVPEGSLLSGMFPVKIAGVSYSLYVFSHLNYGRERIELRYKNELIKNSSSNEIQDPCSVKGHESSLNNKKIKFIGSGNAEICFKILEEILKKEENDWLCAPKPCSVGSVYQPHIPTNMTFYTVGAFKYTFNKIFHGKEKFSFDHLKKKYQEFCPLDFENAKKKYEEKIDRYVSDPCFVSIFSFIFLNNNLGFSYNTTKIMFGPDIEWTLGAIIYEVSQREIKCRCESSLASFPKFNQIIYFIFIFFNIYKILKNFKLI